MANNQHQVAAAGGNPTIVLGMHKSGTTLISEVLDRSGIQMVEGLQQGGYDQGNKMEREETKRLNIDLLNCADIPSYRVFEPLRMEQVTPEHWARGAGIIEKHKDETWGFKDPRTLLTFQFWSRLIEDPILIGVFRKPSEVYHHYRRQKWRRMLKTPHYPLQVLRAWSAYNIALAKVKKASPGMLLMEYSSFMTNEETFQSLQAHLQRPIIDARKPELYRGTSRETREYMFFKEALRRLHGLDVEAIYAELSDLSRESTFSQEAGRQAP